MRVIFTILLFTLIYKGMHAQHTLTGTLSDQSGVAIPAGIVQLLAEDSVTVVNYVNIDGAGKWKMPNVRPGRYIVQISAWEYEMWTQKIEVGASNTLHIATTLLKEATTLKLVEITAQQIGLVEHGDTLLFNLSAYLDSTEYNLKDILNRLPQMSVGGDGSIHYKGERVKVVLAEGRDAFGGMHKLMGESIKAGDVKGIQIIRNYNTGADQVAQANSDKVALNVQLTDRARQRVNGEVKLYSDVRKFVETNNILYRTRPKAGFSIAINGNTTAQSVLGLLDFLTMTDPTDEKNSGSVQDFVPSTFILGPDVQRNRDLFFTFNTDSDPRPNWNSKLNCYYLHTDRNGCNSECRIMLFF